MLADVYQKSGRDTATTLEQLELTS